MIEADLTCTAAWPADEPPAVQAAWLAAWLKQQPLPMDTEQRAQECLERRLAQAGIPFSRHAALAPGDIPDFIVAESIVVELKIKGAALSVYRQCERYAAHESVTAIILLTGRAMTLPETISAKPTLVVHMGAAWL